MATGKQYDGKQTKGYYVIVAPDGNIREANLPDGAHAETFSIMVATARGAIDTALGELKYYDSFNISVESKQYNFNITKEVNGDVLAKILPKEQKTINDKLKVEPTPKQ